MLNDNKETKICKKCGRELPLDRFRFSSANGHPYYRGLCKDCEGVYFKEHSKKKREKEFIFSDNVEIRIGREFKEINPARILNIADLGIIPCGTDEVFVRLMDYKDTWLSNYGRCITRTWGKYGLLDGSYIRGELRYSLRKNVFYDGKWIYKRDYAYAPKMVVETFIVNEDKANNIYVWHSGNDKEDCYYKNLYPLNQEQFRIVRNHFLKTGDDSEEFILKVMNDIRYKPDDWSAKTAELVMYGVGYHGTLYTNSNEDSYDRWHWMMNRCYSTAIHKLYPQYENCTVCKEWLNYSNYKLWYDEHKIEMKVFCGRVSLDKDILIKGNTVYSPETVCIVPQTNGGVVSVNPDDLFSDIAKHNGEDGFIVASNGERVLTERQNVSFEKFVDLITGMNITPQMLMPDFMKAAQTVTNNNRPNYSVNMGEIHLHGVQNVDEFSKEIVKRMPGVMFQSMTGNRR